MNQTMNEMFKKDLPNLHEWCEEYAKRTGVKIYAGNPPVALILESVMAQLKQFTAETNDNIERIVDCIESLPYLSKKEDEPVKKEKVKK